MKTTPTTLPPKHFPQKTAVISEQQLKQLKSAAIAAHLAAVKTGDPVAIAKAAGVANMLYVINAV